ncbi:BREX-3 system phosphatase PglZ [Deferrisoma palaeochoriense]
MGSWRDQILREFAPQVARLTLVADPDGLLLEEGVLDGIRDRGFELIPFEDHVAFRYAYESQFRSRWDRGESTELVVVLRSGERDLDTLPYDLLQAGRKLSFNLGDLFPQLSYSVVAALDRGDLDALFEAQLRYAPGPLGENATKDFVLRHVFEIAPELINEPEDLLRVLLRRHYKGRRIPRILDDRFIQVLRQTHRFQDWPLEAIVPDKQAFFAFLQERWPVFLDFLADRQKFEGVSDDEHAAGYGLKFRGPRLLPFSHDDVRVYIDNLFVEGLLQPVPHEKAESLAKTWVVCGLQLSPGEDRRRRMEGLLDTLEKTIPEVDARHGEWLDFAGRWAELAALEMEPDFPCPEGYRERRDALRSRIDATFQAWVVKRYASLINLPPAPPVMLHHIPRYLSHGLDDNPDTKIALVLLDGIALDQWVAVRQELGGLDPKLRFRERAVFAWIPTLTSVSRQAAFAGKPPIYFPASIHTTEKESDLWTQFWVDQGLASKEVAYAKGLGDGDLEELAELLNRPHLRVVGLVVDKVDRIMHGMELGAAGMHNQVRQWAREGFLKDMLGLLHERGFRVYLASDHGNIEAMGVGKPSEGSLAEVRGERVRVYDDPVLRKQVSDRFPDAYEWPPVGLPETYLALLAPERGAFVTKGKKVVSHGGWCIEELIVPFAELEVRGDAS